VKKIIKIVFLFLILTFYISNVIEWNDKEWEQNYQKECRLYTLTEKTAFKANLSLSIPSQVIIQYFQIQRCKVLFSDKIKLFPTSPIFKKTNKLFLHNRALLL
jgi:hypothetical protein